MKQENTKSLSQFLDVLKKKVTLLLVKKFVSRNTYQKDHLWHTLLLFMQLLDCR